jgi:hypothetical protein
MHMSRGWSNSVIPPDFDQEVGLFSLSTPTTGTFAQIILHYNDRTPHSEYQPEEGLQLAFRAYAEGKKVVDVNEIYRAGSGEKIKWPPPDQDE